MTASTMCIIQVFSIQILVFCSNETVLDSTSIPRNVTFWPEAESIEILFGEKNFILNFTMEFIDRTHVNISGRSTTPAAMTCGSSEKNGISFKNITMVTLQNIELKKCGFIMQQPRRMVLGIGIVNASNIWISNVNLFNSRGLGLYIGSFASQSTNTFFSLEITRSTFKNNRGYYGGGVYVNLTNPGITISVTNTIFENNAVMRSGGGGLRLFFNRVSSPKLSWLNFYLKNCTFTRNKANHDGGGLDINAKLALTNISIESTSFQANEAMRSGGGVAMHLRQHYCINSNFSEVHFINTGFHQNVARNEGGGLLLHVYYSLFVSTCNNMSVHDSHLITLKNCMMKLNEARVAAAAMLTNFKSALKKYWLSCVFENCSFSKNSNKNTLLTTVSATTPTSLVCNGSVIARNFVLYLRSNNSFTNNSGTALCLESSNLIVETSSRTLFSCNHGDYGGALAMHLLSRLKLGFEVRLHFNHNLATRKGGALFVEERKYSCYSECFLAVQKNSNAILSFNGNRISGSIDKCHKYGNSIYIHSISKCENITNFINSSKNVEFTFGAGNTASCEISTKLTLKKNHINEPLQFIPGKKRSLPVEVVNDFNIPTKQTKHCVYINTYNVNGSFTTTVDSYGNITLKGKPKGNGSLSLHMLKRHVCYPDESIKFPVELLQCPPGFVFENLSCLCSITHSYVGISECDSTNFQAHIARTYYIGYYLKDNVSASNLYTSLCPQGFCHMSSTTVSINLPSEANLEELDNLTCGPNRTGFLCARCRDNHSCYFHAENLNCLKNKKCSLGFLFFFLSEILPVSITLFFVIFFNIQLASGSIQGFILYAQIFESLHIRLGHERAFRYLQMFYHMFNLEFFRHDDLSFCLWKGASTLNILAMKYVTIIYSLLLIITVILVWNKCSGKIRRCSHKTSKISAVHGLSSFLILCYSQLTKISLLILTPATVYDQYGKYHKRVVFYDGEIDFFRKKHLEYVIPIILFAVPFVVVPPFLLFIYPLCYKVFTLLNLEESVLLKVTCRIIPLEKYRPLFDSFQSSFKNEYRCFAGLYFVYRFLAHLTFAIAHSLSTIYVSVQFQFILMLLLHTLTQPYKKKWHNVLDGYIFSTLALLNGITFLNFHTSYERGQPHEEHSYFSIIQVGLAYLPILVILGHYVYAKKRLLAIILQKLSSLGKMQLLRKKAEDDEIILSLQENRDIELSTSYKQE